MAQGTLAPGRGVSFFGGIYRGSGPPSSKTKIVLQSTSFVGFAKRGFRYPCTLPRRMKRLGAATAWGVRGAWGARGACMLACPSLRTPVKFGSRGRPGKPNIRPNRPREAARETTGRLPADQQPLRCVRSEQLPRRSARSTRPHGFQRRRARSRATAGLLTPPRPVRQSPGQSFRQRPLLPRSLRRAPGRERKRFVSLLRP